MSLLREVKPRNARTARIVKAREPQLIEGRKRVLLLHGSKCPTPVRVFLKTVSTLTKPHSILLTKKNGDIHPFEDPKSLEFLAGKNECGIVVFGTHSKKRPNNLTLARIFNSQILDMVELSALNNGEELENPSTKFSIGTEMKPLILFAGSQWDDESSSDSASMYRMLKSMLLDVFQGEEIPSIDVAGLQYVLMIATGESSSTNTNFSNGSTTAAASSSSMSNDPSSRPVLHLRWYKIRTTRSNTPKMPRVELDPIGPPFDLRVGRSREADHEIMKEALKQGRRPNESARTKKNIETDLVGDKLGRVHLGKQDLSQLQTRKMKGLKRSRDEDGDGNNVVSGLPRNGSGGVDEDDDEEIDISENGGMEVDVDEDEDEYFSQSEGGSSGGGTGDEIDVGESDGDDDDAMQAAEMPKRQRLR